MMDNRDVADVQRTIILERNAVSRILRMMRGALSEVRVMSVPQIGEAAAFVRDCVSGRMQMLMDALQENTYWYMSPPFDPQYDGVQLKRDEARLDRYRWQMTRLTMTDRIAFKFADPSVSVMFMLKGARLIAQVGALFVAQKAFSELYVRTVHAEGKDPPHIWRMMLMFLSIDATLQLFTLLLVVIVSHTYRGREGHETLVLDDDLIATYLLEYFFSTIVVGALGYAIARLMRHKRYFEYSERGSAVGRAYRDIMIAVCGINFVIPYFLIV